MIYIPSLFWYFFDLIALIKKYQSRYKGYFMKKQIISYVGLYLLFINSLSFSMGPIIRRQPDPSALLSQEQVTKFIDNASQKTKNIADIILKRSLQSNDENNPIKGFISFIISGSNGIGKTSIVKAIIEKSGRPFAFLTPCDLIQKNRLQVLQNAIEPFLKNDLPCIIATDDIEKFHNFSADGNEGLEPDDILAQYMDTAEHKDRERNNPHFIFLGTTNNLPEVSRKVYSRSIIFEMNYPEYSSRFKILTDLITNRKGINSGNCDEKFIESVAQRTEAFSIRDLIHLIDNALYNIQIEQTNNAPGYYLKQIHIETLLKQILPPKKNTGIIFRGLDFATTSPVSISVGSFLVGILMVIAREKGATVARNWLKNRGL